MRTKYIITVITIGAAIVYSQFNSDTSTSPISQIDHVKVNLSSEKNKSDTITTKASSINHTVRPGKSVEQQFIINGKNKYQERDLLKSNLVSKLLEKTLPTDFNKLIETSFSESMIKSNKNKALVLKFLKHYPFKKLYKNAYSELSIGELDAMFAVFSSHASQKMQDLQISSQKKTVEYIKKNKEYKMSDEKRSLINSIVDEGNLIERSKEVTSQIVETIIAHAYINENGKLSAHEARAKAKPVVEEILKGQEKNMYKGIYISFDNLSKNELDEYLNVLQRTDAKKAFLASSKISSKILDKFMIEFLEIIVKK